MKIAAKQLNTSVMELDAHPARDWWLRVGIACQMFENYLHEQARAAAERA